MDLTQFAAVAGVIITNIITIITLYIHLDSKTDKMLNAIYIEMKDFHGRLEKQDADFKGKLATQDAEFKSGMLLLEEKIKNRG